MSNIKAAIEQLRTGGMIIIQDDASRENEGDLVCVADACSATNINFMTTHGRGLICLALPYVKVEELQLPMQPVRGNNKFQTPFTVSIDAADNITTGISAAERALTIRTASATDCQISDLATPGHVFPLRAHPDGVLGRSGHTEASIAIMELAGLANSAVICEIMNIDGTMARDEDLQVFAARYQLPFITIEDIKLEFIKLSRMTV